MGEEQPQEQPQEHQPDQPVSEDQFAQHALERQAGQIDVEYHDGGDQPVETVNEDAKQPEPAEEPVAEEQTGPNYVHNEEKAEVMAHAQDDAIKKNEESSGRYTAPDYAAEKAGVNYDLVEASKGFKTPEEARKFALLNKNTFLEYGGAIAENYRKHGDRLPPNLVALETVKELAGDVGYNNFPVDNLQFSQIHVELDETHGGAIVVKSVGSSRGGVEQWRIPMFGDGSYEITQNSGDPDGKFNRIETKKIRKLNEEDVTNLDELLKPAKEFKERMRKLDDRNRDDDGSEDDYVSSTEIRRRAEAQFGDTELAREAAEMYPGDLVT